ncbi:MAG: hypothetical protein ACD_4C00459G0002 [uncultured bacterium (gcode 4)]|uniref:Uncharacterized protein n=1 Tax=uncultured bacterium (gcode 4) TaxID=1234023 RepID=K2FT32_9BACT|nr:MAG: hypothetical protein ACD_4C00459G0002 [uncultured bacterium (gcode 4)]
MNSTFKSRSLREVSICQNYEEVLKSEYFDEFIECVTENYTENLEFNEKTISVLTGNLWFKFVFTGDTEQNEKLAKMNIKTIIINLFSDIKAAKFIDQKKMDILKFVYNDESFMNTVKNVFKNIWALKWGNLEGKLKFIRMFMDEPFDNKKCRFEFFEFMVFLNNKISENNTVAFWKSISKEVWEEVSWILESENSPKNDSFPGYEIITEWKNFSLFANSKNEHKKDFYIYDKEKQEFVKKYKIEVSDLNTQDVLPKNVITAKNTETWKMCLLDLDNWEEIIDYNDKYGCYVKYDSCLYFCLIKYPNAVIYNFTKRKIEITFENSEFDYFDLSSENIRVKSRWWNVSASQIYSLKDKEIILWNFQEMRDLWKLDDGSFKFIYTLCQEKSFPDEKIFIEWIWSINFVFEDILKVSWTKDELKVIGKLKWSKMPLRHIYYTINTKTWKITTDFKKSLKFW